MEDLLKYLKSLGFKTVKNENGYVLLRFSVNIDIDLTPVDIFIRFTNTFLSVYERSKVGVSYQLHNYLYENTQDAIDTIMKLHAITCYFKEAEELRIKRLA